MIRLKSHNKLAGAFVIWPVGVLALVLSLGCATKVLKYEKTEQLKNIKEFDQSVKIVTTEEPAPTPTSPTEPKPAEPKADELQKKTTETVKNPPPLIPKKEVKKNKSKTKNTHAKNAEVAKPARQPELESQTGFEGRRPLVDPFHVGEKIVHSVNYFKMRAGYLTMSTKPMAMVNDRNSYQFEIAIRTSDFFSKFYAVDDHVVTWLDFEELIPSVFQLHVRETAQIRESRAIFDFKNKMARFWEKKVTEKSGEEEKKLEWEILDYSQNVYSAAYYLRIFQWPLGAENAFRVANDGENLVFRAKAIRKEKLNTDIGSFDTVVIKPEIELKGVFKPVGDIFIWLSDDDKKHILRIESKIKIGTLVSEVMELVP